MTIFVDTSALLAVLDGDDAMHPPAKNTWSRCLNDRQKLLTTNYVIVETAALVQSRFGMSAARVFHEAIVPMLQIEWIAQPMHTTAVSALLTANRRNLSLVDCVSFETMRRLGLTEAFTVDRHFAEQGFAVVP